LNDTRGFTLIELVVVLAIMALVFVVAAPQMGSFLPRTELKSGARQLAAGLREARSRAIRSNGDVVFSVDVNGRRYSMTGDGVPHPLPDKIKLSLFTVQQEQRSNSVGSIRFFPDGTSTGGHVLVFGDDIAYKVNVDWLTGRVEIQDQPPPDKVH
jgi:general secretion pathway protein H